MNNNRNDSSTITLNQENDNTLAENSLYQGLYIFQNANLSFFSQIFSGKGNEAEFQKYFNDCKLAFELFQKAATAGYARSMCELALCYFNGEGVPKNYTKAVQWFQKAADAGNVEAINTLKICYREGVANFYSLPFVFH